MLRRTRLDDHVDNRPDGTPRNVADAICDHLVSGLHLNQAIALVGVAPNTVTAWLREGARLNMANVPRRQMTKSQRLAATFQQAALVALAECERRDVHNLDRLAQGGIKLTTTQVETITYETADGETVTDAVRMVTTTKELAPDLKAITWRLSRRWPTRYYQPAVVPVGLPGPDDADREPAAVAVAEARRMVEREREVRAALDPGVIDAKVVDERPLRLDDT